MTERIKMRTQRLLADAWGRLTQYTFDYRHTDGSWLSHTYEVYDHGHAATILLQDPQRDFVTLVRQFRLPVHLGGDQGFVLEACAGMLDGDAPEACVRREALEETGLQVADCRYLFCAYASPGSLSEKIHFFIGTYAGPVPHTSGGLDHEGEDIEVVELRFDDAFAMIETGEIIDAKTIMLLQALKLERLQAE